MRRDVLVIALMSFITVAVTLSAQGKPDFSGNWVLDTTSGDGAGRGGPITAGVQLMVKQDAKTLTLTRLQGDQTVTETVNLDGSETREMIEALGGTRERVSRATWDGNKLVINATLSVDGKILQQNRVMSMEGGNLVIEQIGPGGGGPATIRRVFKKG
jgi:hypothetical protein